MFFLSVIKPKLKMRLEKKNKKEKEDKSERSLTHEYGTVKPRARAQAAVLLEHHQT